MADPVPGHPEWALASVGTYPSGRTRYEFRCKKCGNTCVSPSPKRVGPCPCARPGFTEAVKAAAERIKVVAAADPKVGELAKAVLGGVPEPRVFRKARFSVDDDVSFEGWTSGDLWNGWDCPFFEKGEADRLAARIAENVKRTGYRESLTYVPKGDAFVFVTEDDESAADSDTTQGQDIETPEGKKHVYPIGAWSWVWKEAPAEPPLDDLPPWRRSDTGGGVMCLLSTCADGDHYYQLNGWDSDLPVAGKPAMISFYSESEARQVWARKIPAFTTPEEAFVRKNEFESLGEA